MIFSVSFRVCGCPSKRAGGRSRFQIRFRFAFASDSVSSLVSVRFTSVRFVLIQFIRSVLFVRFRLIIAKGGFAAFRLFHSERQPVRLIWFGFRFGFVSPSHATARSIFDSVSFPFASQAIAQFLSLRFQSPFPFRSRLPSPATARSSRVILASVLVRFNAST